MGAQIDILTTLHGRKVGLGPRGNLITNHQNGAQRGGSRLVTITSAQLLAMFATPVALVPAPGAGLVLIPKEVLIRKPAGTAYAGIAAGENLLISYTDGAGATPFPEIETANFLDQTTAQFRHVTRLGTEVIPVANAALVISLLVGEITTGTGGLVVETFYDIVPAAFT